MSTDSTATPSTRRPPAERPALPAVLAERIGFLLAKGHLAAREAADEALRPLGLEVKEYASLLILESEGSMAQGELAILQRADRTTMVAIVDALESAGYVERRRNPSDRRAYALEITPAGREALERAHRLIGEAEQGFLAPLGAAERRQLTRLLRRLLAG